MCTSCYVGETRQTFHRVLSQSLLTADQQPVYNTNALLFEGGIQTGDNRSEPASRNSEQSWTNDADDLSQLDAATKDCIEFMKYFVNKIIDPASVHIHIYILATFWITTMCYCCCCCCCRCCYCRGVRCRFIAWFWLHMENLNNPRSHAAGFRWSIIKQNINGL